CLGCLGQSNVYRLRIYSGGHSYSAGWTIGSPPNCFGLQDEEWWENRAGQTVSWIGHKIEPGDVHRWRTTVYLGFVDIHVPLPRGTVAIIGIVATIAFACLVAVAVPRLRGSMRNPKGNAASPTFDNTG